MSSMNFMEKLLDGVKVEWQLLEQVAKIKHGKDWKGLDAGDVPIYGSGGIMGSVDTYSYNKPSVLIPRKGSITNIFYIETPFWNVDTIFYTEIDESKIVPKFLYYFIKTIDMMALDTGSGRPSLTQAILNKIQIPIPCPENPEKSFEIQAEIVRILDAFTELITELITELSARKKQYNYYRDQLLSFEEGVPLLPLSQCCESIADGDHQAPQKTENGIPFITISDVSATNQIDFNNTKFVSDSYYDALDCKRKARTNDILYTVVGSFGIPVYIDSDKKFAFQRHIAILRPNPSIVISKYIYHALRGSNVVKQAHSVATGAAQKTITLMALNRMQIAVPSLEEQARIVAILDKFEALTNAITEGLPREIALRQKQYEYYRDLLLSFPKPEELAA
ncbi:MAG: type I restriction enzyme, S subunit [Candidatus Nitrotoga sp. MKT]|nr:MAG: type I restriction enzyme, S subunit [Candidatus Nitrotoga sp. MKT]